MAFEQGKFLPTPETVPFRLTRDMVDGMGLTGVEGVYRRCCEKTVEVMRTSHESLMTVVEVSSFVSRLQSFALINLWDQNTSKSGSVGLAWLPQVMTWSEKIFQGQGKVTEFYFESGKIDILKKSQGKLK